MVYTYTSTRADYDPAKLFIVCPPSGLLQSRRPQPLQKPPAGRL